MAIAIKTARELVLLPYTQRTTTERPGGRGGGRGREGGYGGQGGSGRGRRDEERSLSADATSTALADDAPRQAPAEDVVVEEVLDVTGTGDGTLTEVIVEEGGA